MKKKVCDPRAYSDIKHGEWISVDDVDDVNWLLIDPMYYYAPLTIKRATKKNPRGGWIWELQKSVARTASFLKRIW